MRVTLAAIAGALGFLIFAHLIAAFVGWHWTWVWEWSPGARALLALFMGAVGLASGMLQFWKDR